MVKQWIDNQVLVLLFIVHVETKLLSCCEFIINWIIYRRALSIIVVIKICCFLQEMLSKGT